MQTTSLSCDKTGNNDSQDEHKDSVTFSQTYLAQETVRDLQFSNNSFYNYEYQEDWLSGRLEELYKIQRNAQTNTNIALTVFLLPIFIIGLTGNILVLMVFSRSKIKLASTFLIAALATNDLIICGLVLPGVLLKEWFVPFQWDVVCKGWELIRCASIPLSSVILVVVAVDRYILICHAGEIKAMSIKQTRYTVLLATVLSIFHGTPPMLRVGVYQVGTNNKTIYLGLCQGNNLLVGQDLIDHYWQITTAEFILVLLSAVVMYSLVFRTVYRQNKRWASARGRFHFVGPTNAEQSVNRDTACVDTLSIKEALSEQSECSRTDTNISEKTTYKTLHPPRIINQDHMPTYEVSKPHLCCEGDHSVSRIQAQVTLSESSDLSYFQAALSNKCLPNNGDACTEVVARDLTINNNNSVKQHYSLDSYSQSGNDDVRVGSRQRIILLGQNCKKLSVVEHASDTKDTKTLEASSVKRGLNSSDRLISPKLCNLTTNSETLITDCDIIIDEPPLKHVSKDIISDVRIYEFDLHKQRIGITQPAAAKRHSSWANSGAAIESYCKPKQIPGALKKLCDRRTHPATELDSSSWQQEQLTPRLPVPRHHQQRLSCIGRQLPQSTKQGQDGASGASKDQNKQKHRCPQKKYSTAQVKTAKVLLLVTIVFIVSFAPVLLMTLNAIPSHPIPFYSYFIHSAANPLIYSFINQVFRRQLQNLVLGKKT